MVVRRSGSLGVVTVAAAFAASLLVVSCSSGSSPSAGPESLPPANTSSAGSCPFAGTTASTQGAGLAAGAVISSVIATVSGCIDSATARFATAPPSWSVGYSDGPFVDARTGKAVSVSGPVNLVVTFKATTFPSLQGGPPPATVAPGHLHYVKQLTVITGSGGSLEWIVSLPQEMQYTTSVSQTPAYFVLSIG